VVIDRVMKFIWSTGAGHPFWWDDRIAPSSYAYAAALTLLIALICGITPALKGTRQGVSGSLQAEGRSTSAKFGATWTTVIVVQVALMVVLLPPAISQAWQGFRARPGGAGFAAGEYLSAYVLLNVQAGAPAEQPGAPDADDQRLAASLRDLERELGAAPFVKGVTFASTFPGTFHNTTDIEIEDVTFADRQRPRIYSATVAPDFFATLEVPVLAGRDFVNADADNGLVVIVNQQLVAHLGGRNPIGRHLRRRMGGAAGTLGPPMEIVGVVRDLGFSPMRPDDAAGFYEVAKPGTKGINQVAVHLPGLTDGPGAFAQQLREVAFKANPHLLTLQPLPLNLAGQAELVAFRVFASAMFFVAVMGVVLSTAGVYSMMSFTVSRRTREIAIRTALGADSRRVIAAIFSRAVLQLAAGAALGVALVVYMRPEFAKEVWLPVSLGLLMMVIGTFACLAPARRALRIQPSDALKDS
jgi:putative ABC transport system permease protein